MKRDLMEILCCPMCKGDITLSVIREEGIEIKGGTLYCQKYNIFYPIENGIPNMLPPDMK